MNRSSVNLGNGAVKKTGVRKRMAGGGMVKKTGVRKFRGGGMVKKTGVKKMAIGGIVAGAGRAIGKKIGEKGLKKLSAAEEMLKDLGKGAAKAAKANTRKGRPPKSKMAKIKSRVNIGAAAPLEAAAYTAGGYALGASGKKEKKKNV